MCLVRGLVSIEIYLPTYPSRKDWLRSTSREKGWKLLSGLDIGHPFVSGVPKVGWTAGEVVTSGWLVATYRSITPQSVTYQVERLHGRFCGSYLTRRR